MTDSTPPDDRLHDHLHAYVDGELDDAEAAAFEAHLATCETCLAELPRLLALLEALDGAAQAARPPAAEAAPAARVPAERPAGLTVVPGGRTDPLQSPRSSSAPPRRSRWRPAAWAGGLAVAAAVAIALFAIPPRPPVPDAVAIAEAVGTTRPFEVRLSAAGADRYRPMNVARGAAPGPTSDRLIKLELQLAEAHDARGEAAVALFAGDRERAARVLTGARTSPEIESDRAAVELIEGEPAALVRALDHADRALAAAPALPSALWNRALVLAALDLPLAAATELDRVAALGESGWADEARQRAAALRDRVKARRVLWQQVTAAKRTLLDDPARVPLDLAQVPGFLTVMLYDAARAAPSPDAARALLPLAQELDRAHHNDQLTRYVQRVAASDFKIRKPLADTYRRLVLGPPLDPPALDAFLQQLDRGQQDDILLGALVRADRVQARLDDYRRLAAASGDPWFAAYADQETAVAEIARGQYAAAERRLHRAIAAAQAEHLEYRALTLRGKLVELYRAVRQLTQADDVARAEYREAIAAGEAVIEMGALADLAAIDQDRYANGLARAYLTEQLERTQSSDAIGPAPLDEARTCSTRQYAYHSLASLALDALQPDRARDLLARAPDCGRDLDADMLVRRALFASELYRLGGQSGDAELARASIGALAARTLMPGQQAMAELIQGDLALDTDRDASRRHLRDAIARAGDDADHRSVKARAYGYSLLALAAGRTEQFPEVLDLLAKALDVPRPGRCVVAIARYAERSVVAIADARGATTGRYVGDWKSPELDAAVLIPPDLVDRLRGCDRVAVLARAPVLGIGRLLPPDLAWSYLLAGPPARTARTPIRGADNPRLVVANPETLSELKLPPLAPYPAAPEPGTQVLRGADATPSRVLGAMRDASVIEFHTHGILGNDVSESSYLVLAPEIDRQYALTARDLADTELSARPLVILGACHAADSSKSLEGGVGLPEAFLRSGARAVIASPDTVEDVGGGEFFSAVRERVLHGADPSAAVRDERLHRLALSHDDAWASGVVVFESADTVPM